MQLENFFALSSNVRLGKLNWSTNINSVFGFLLGLFIIAICDCVVIETICFTPKQLFYDFYCSMTSCMDGNSSKARRPTALMMRNNNLELALNLKMRNHTPLHKDSRVLPTQYPLMYSRLNTQDSFYPSEGKMRKRYKKTIGKKVISHMPFWKQSAGCPGKNWHF